eukprot:scaffold2646_cov103-Isochrysis_galbana.AAC.1
MSCIVRMLLAARGGPLGSPASRWYPHNQRMHSANGEYSLHPSPSVPHFGFDTLCVIQNHSSHWDYWAC